MARQIIDTTTNNGSYIGDPAKIAFEKVNANDLELYTRVGVVEPIASGALQRSGGTLTGPVLKTGVAGQLNFGVSNTGTQDGIGGTFATWASRVSAMLVSAQNPSLAYSIAKVTNGGVKDLIGIDVYQGGASSDANVELDFHFSTGVSRHRFIDTGSMIIAGTLTQNSDYRIKEEKEEISPVVAADKLRASRPIEYIDIQDNSRPSRSGFIAHELKSNFPLLVDGEKDATRIEERMVGDTTPYFPGEEPNGYIPPHIEMVEVPVLQNVNYIGMIPYLTAGWQHSDTRISELETKNAELASRILALEASLHGQK